MPSPTQTAYVRIRPGALAAMLVVPLLAAGLMQASGQDGLIGETAIKQEYVVYEPTDLIFASVDLAAQFLRNRGLDGWIVPDGTQILVHTFEPGTNSQYTRYLVAPSGAFDEESRHLILRRPSR